MRHLLWIAVFAALVAVVLAPCQGHHSSSFALRMKVLPSSCSSVWRSAGLCIFSLSLKWFLNSNGIGQHRRDRPAHVQSG